MGAWGASGECATHSSPTNYRTMLKTLTKLILILNTSVLFVVLFWSKSLILIILLMLTLSLKHKISPIKNELLWFATILISSYLVEILLVNFTGAWSYSNSYVFGVPVWASLFWAVIGVTSFSIFSLINKNDK